MTRKKILFFHAQPWVMGKIHSELAKALYPYVQADFADWLKPYEQDQFNFFIEKYDYIVTTLYGAYLTNHHWSVDPKQLIAICHGNRCAVGGVEEGVDDEFVNSLAGVGVVSQSVKEFCENDCGFTRAFPILPIGVFADNYQKRDPNRPVTTIGNFADLSRPQKGLDGEVYDVKRGHLIKELVAKTGMKFSHRTGAPNIASESIYNDTDIYAFAAVDEGNPMGLIEAAACGIPTIGPNTGVMPEAIAAGAAFELPMDEEGFIEEGTRLVEKLKTDKKFYREASMNALNWATRDRDWAGLAWKYIQFFENPRAV